MRLTVLEFKNQFIIFNKGYYHELILNNNDGDKDLWIGHEDSIDSFFLKKGFEFVAKHSPSSERGKFIIETFAKKFKETDRDVYLKFVSSPAVDIFDFVLEKYGK